MKMMTLEQIASACPDLKWKIERQTSFLYWGEYLSSYDPDNSDLLKTDCGQRRGGAASDIGTSKLFLTVFKNETGSQRFKAELTLPEWRDKIQAADADAKNKLFWLKGAKFGDIKSKQGSYRTNLNVEWFTAIVVEYDGGEISVDDATAILAKADLRALIYTSPSHSSANPRWRIILPLSYNAAKTRHDILVATVNGLFDGKLAPESFTLSQSYYFGAVNRNPDHRCEIIDGKFLDLQSRLYAGAIFKDGSRVGDNSPVQRLREAMQSDGAGNHHAATRIRNTLPDDPAKVAFALNQISADCPYRAKVDGEVAWMTIGAALASEVEHDEGFEIFDAWSKTSAKYDAATIAEKWNDFCEMSFIGIGTLYHFTTEANPDWRKEWKAKESAGAEQAQEKQIEKQRTDAKVDWAKVPTFKDWLTVSSNLPKDAGAAARLIVDHVGGLLPLGVDFKHAGLRKKGFDNWTDVQAALATALLVADGMSNEKVAAALLCPLACNRDFRTLTEPQIRVAVERAIRSATDEIAKQQTDAKAYDESNSGNNIHVTLTKAYLANLRKRDEMLRIVADNKGNESVWRCGKTNLWEPVISVNSQIDGAIERIARALGIITNNQMISQTREYILRDPNIRPSEGAIRIEWDAHGKIAVRDKLLDPKTMAIEPLRKDHYATQSMDFDYDPDAKCPLTVQAFDALFADRAPALRSKTIGLMQEVGGMGLINKKDNKALSKVLIFQGPSNSGKSTGGETIIGMYPGKKIATSLEAISGPHGLEEFATSNGCWALHEAFNKGVWIPPQILKTIISGEPISINPKNGKLITKIITNPIVWMTNPPVQISEESAAIKNRLIVMMTRVVFDEKILVGVGAIARAHGYDKIDQFLLATEKPGIFNWMLAGAQRAMKRGFFENTEEGQAALDEIQTAGNVVGSFLEECVIYGPTFMMSVADYCAAFKAHYQQTKSTKNGTPANDSVSRALLSKGDPCIGVNTKELRDNKGRYYVGMHLNAAGLAYWEAVADGDRFGSLHVKTVQTADNASKVNQTIPKSWHDRPTVKRVMEADFTKHDQERAEAEHGADYRTDEEKAKATPRF
jgi:phage/plasmid-associated DNA primase